MTIVTTSDSKKKERPKPAPKTVEQHAAVKADALQKKLRLNVGIKEAMGAIEKIIEDLVDEHKIPFDHACTYVHLGRRVFKD
jgi:hypothetical protein